MGAGERVREKARAKLKMRVRVRKPTFNTHRRPRTHLKLEPCTVAADGGTR